MSTNDPVQKLRYASACAADLVKHVEITGELPESSAQAISSLQHSMMNVLPDVKRAEADLMVKDMFTLLDDLEGRLKS